MFLVPHGEPKKAGSWYRTFMRNPERTEVILFICPNGHESGLAGWRYKFHTIADDGTVSPSLVCTHPGCTFHEFVVLADWDGRCIEHKWTGAKSGAPGEPVEWVEYCDICGVERGGSYDEGK